MNWLIGQGRDSAINDGSGFFRSEVLPEEPGGGSGPLFTGRKPKSQRFQPGRHSAGRAHEEVISARFQAGQKDEEK